MKYPLSLLFLLAALWVSSPSFAIVGRVSEKDKMVESVAAPIFTCAPAGFTLTKNDNGLHLQGALQVPTPGFTYDITQEEPGPDGSIHGTLHLKAPEGIVAQVISALAIDYTFAGEGDRLTVNVDGIKSDAIECKMAGITQ